ncbi:MAG TPA: hypothetical protein VE028_10805 [Nitratidesulfovibrio sp.]|nr:hypothetical protein [Nitratidesulfovibrio sp.]
MCDTAPPKPQNHTGENLYIQTWTATIPYADEKLNNISRSRIDAAFLAIKSMYILNGGALFILPQISQLPQMETPTGIIVGSAIFFIIGLILTITSNYQLYFALNDYEVWKQHDRELTACQINISHGKFKIDDVSKKLSNHESEKLKFYIQEAKRRSLAIITYVASALSFTLGALTPTLFRVYLLYTTSRH